MLNARLIIAIALTSVTSVQLLGQEKTPRNTALSPAESLASIKIEEGFEIKIIAHEPQVIDPVDAAFDDQLVARRDLPRQRDLAADDELAQVGIAAPLNRRGHAGPSVAFRWSRGFSRQPRRVERARRQ